MASREMRTRIRYAKTGSTVICSKSKRHPNGCLLSDGNFAVGKYTHSLRLASELADLRSGYANPHSLRENGFDRHLFQKQKAPEWVLTKTGISPTGNISTLAPGE